MAPLYLTFCPYLPLDRAYAIGPWSLVPLAKFKGTWASAEFESLGRAFIAKFDDARDKPLPAPSLLTRGEVADGVLPSAAELAALQAALTFAALDRNPIWTPEADAWSTITSDNAELFVWPINLTSRTVALGRGVLVRSLGGGYKIEGSSWRLRSPLELHMPHGTVRLDRELLDAIYRVAMGEKGHLDLASAITLAISWLAKAWRNTPSLSQEDRLIELKTAFDALTDLTKGVQVAEEIRRRFEVLKQYGANRTSSQHLLWRSDEVERVRTVPDARGNPQLRTVTPLQEWFAHFAAARNAVIHEAAAVRAKPPLRTRYKGPYFHTGERLLRDAIRASLVPFGFDQLWRSVAEREFHALVAAALAQTANA